MISNNPETCYKTNIYILKRLKIFALLKMWLICYLSQETHMLLSYLFVSLNNTEYWSFVTIWKMVKIVTFNEDCMILFYYFGYSVSMLRSVFQISSLFHKTKGTWLRRDTWFSYLSSSLFVSHYKMRSFQMSMSLFICSTTGGGG